MEAATPTTDASTSSPGTVSSGAGRRSASGMRSGASRTGASSMTVVLATLSPGTKWRTGNGPGTQSAALQRGGRTAPTRFSEMHNIPLCARYASVKAFGVKSDALLSRRQLADSVRGRCPGSSRSPGIDIGPAHVPIGRPFVNQPCSTATRERRERAGGLF